MKSDPSKKEDAALTRRLDPRQERSARTVDAILDAAARLLAAVGFEGLSTNKVCAAAGMTPPALYRYFPNKYALLRELGERLMARQNAALAASSFDAEAAEASLAAMLRSQYAVTAEQPGGAWIMRSLRAAPMLAEVRVASHDRVTEALVERLAAAFPDAEPQTLRRKMRFAVEIGYATLEYLFDLEPEAREDAIDDAARLLALHFDDLRGGA